MYTKEYFIKKVEGIPSENFISGMMGVDGCHCMLGHCGVVDSKWTHNEESIALSKLLNPDFEREVGMQINLNNPVMLFNDRIGGMNADLKKRWLKKLRSL